MKILVFVFAVVIASAYGLCPSGFIHHGYSCYSVLLAEGSWADGMMMCQELGAQLATIDGQAEQTFIEGFLKRYGSGFPNDADFWIGGADFLQEGQWIWPMENEPIETTFWAPGQPNNSGGSQGCLRISASKNYKWEDGACNSKEYPVCELPVESK